MAQDAPVTGAKAPPAVALDVADAERRDLYTPLAEAFATPVAKDAQPFASNPNAQTAELLQLAEPPPLEIKDSDKQEFVRALLSGSSYARKYPLYGRVTALLADRTPDDTEKLFMQLNALQLPGVNLLDDQTYQVWYDRFSLASNLRELTLDGGIRTYLPTDKLHDRVVELMRLSRPMFAALLQANRDFEQLLDQLTARAQDQSFWKSGGPGSPAKRQ